MPGQTATIGKGETIEHLLADRARLQRALREDRADSLSAEKRASLTVRLGEVEQQLREIKSAIGDL